MFSMFSTVPKIEPKIDISSFNKKELLDTLILLTAYAYDTTKIESVTGTVGGALKNFYNRRNQANYNEWNHIPQDTDNWGKCETLMHGACDFTDYVEEDKDTQVKYNIKYVIPTLELANFKTDKKIIEVFQEIVKNKDLENIHFCTNKPIIMRNQTGICDEHRGSNHTKLKLKFYDKVLLSKQFTLLDFVINCYKLKSHKFDKYFEHCEYIDLVENTDCYVLSLYFKHVA